MTTQEIYNIIKEAIITAYNENILSEVRQFKYRNAKNIGKEKVDYNKWEDVKEEFINPKTGRVNHKKVGRRHARYIYTQEMYNQEFDKVIENARKKETVRFRTTPDDSLRIFTIANCNPTDKDIEKIYNSYGDLAEHIIGFKSEYYNYYGGDYPESYSHMTPIFDKETNGNFYNSMESYCKAKQEWCDKYGAE